MPTRIQLRRGNAAEWTGANPILASGELGLERDTRLVKFGDGETAWNDLPYSSGRLALVALKTWGPPSVVAGGSTTTTVPVPGAAIGDPAIASHNALTDQGVVLQARVTAVDLATVILINTTAAAFDLANGTLRVRVFKT
jgi:hypothetical protein